MWPIVTWTLFLTLTKNLIFKDLYVLTRTGSTIINQKLVDSMFAPGAVAIQKWNCPLFWSQTWCWNGPGMCIWEIELFSCSNRAFSCSNRRASVMVNSEWYIIFTRYRMTPGMFQSINYLFLLIAFYDWLLHDLFLQKYTRNWHAGSGVLEPNLCQLKMLVTGNLQVK